MTLAAVLILSSFTVCLVFAKGSSEKSEEAMEQTILRLLSDPAFDAIQDYYGEPRQYWKDKLLSVQKAPNTSGYQVVMQVETFYGPHNPPYGIETMTFSIRYGEVELKSFKHQDE